MATKTHFIRRGRIGLNIVLQVLAVAVALGVANYYAFNNYRRWDVSRDEGHDLSGQTRGLLKKLKDEVKIIVLFQQHNVLLADMMNLLKEYQYSGNRKVTVELVHPATSYERALDLKGRYEFELSEDVVIIEAKGGHKIISAHELAEFDTSGIERGMRPRVASFLGERVITSALLELIEGKPAVVYVVQGHGEPEPSAAGDMSRLGAAITRQNIKMRGLTLGGSVGVPEDAEAVMLAGAQVDLDEQAISALTAYWAQGGRILIFLWNGAQTPRLNGFLAGRGVFPRNDQVLYVVREGVAVRKVRDVLCSPSGGHAVTRRYKDLTVILRGRTLSLGLGEPAPVGLRTTPLLMTHARAAYWGESDFASIEAEREPVFDAEADTRGPLIVGAAVEQEGPSDERIKSRTGRLIVVGNGFCVHNTGLTAGVVDFVSSSLNWLLDRAELTGITPKPSNEFPPNLSEEQLRSVMTYVVVVMPTCAAVMAFVVWLIRRR